MKGFDTHIHTTASDGICTPAQVVERAKAQGLQGIAITDHDTVGALAAAELLSAEQGFPIIPGIELSSEQDGRDVHILGYFIDRTSPKLLNKLAELAASRQTRIWLMMELLREHGMPIEESDLAIEQGQSAGRPHLARALLQKGYVKSEKEAFEKWIGRGMCCYVERAKLDPFSALNMVREAGGIPCLAHPGLGVPMELIHALIAEGLAGIEVYHPEHTANDEVKYYALAQERGLIYLGGSDFHGTGDKQIGAKFSAMEQVQLLYTKAGRSI